MQKRRLAQAHARANRLQGHRLLGQRQLHTTLPGLVDQFDRGHGVGHQPHYLVLLQGHIGRARILEGHRVGAGDADRLFGSRALGGADAFVLEKAFRLVGIDRTHHQGLLGDVVRVAELDLVGTGLGVGQIGEDHIHAAHFHFGNARFHRHRLELQLHAKGLGQGLTQVHVHAHQLAADRVRRGERRHVGIHAAVQGFFAHHVAQLIGLGHCAGQGTQRQRGQQLLYRHNNTPQRNNVQCARRSAIKRCARGCDG